VVFVSVQIALVHRSHDETRKEMWMERMIAMCGLDCGPCEARLATQADDQPGKEVVAAKWRDEYGQEGIDAVYVSCDGCLSGGLLGGYCAMCEIRTCGVARGLTNCASCDEFDMCDRLAAFFKLAPPAEANLREIRGKL